MAAGGSGAMREARARATEKLHELAALSAQLHNALLESRLRELLGP